MILAQPSATGNRERPLTHAAMNVFHTWCGRQIRYDWTVVGERCDGMDRTEQVTCPTCRKRVGENKEATR